MVIASVLEENTEIDEDALMQDLSSELKMKVSIDELDISLNALELRTRSADQGGAGGLKRAVS